jgi:nitroreductase
MELIETIKGRRSIREYNDTPIPRELIEEIIESATWAPSAKNGQQWRFTVYTGAVKKGLTDAFRATLDEFVEKYGFEESGSSTWSCGVMEQAPVVIMVWNTGEEGWDSEIHSVAAAIQNMLLRAYDLGLGSLWIADVFYAQEALTRHTGVPWKMVAAVTIGYTDIEGRVPPRKGVHEVATFLE